MSLDPAKRKGYAKTIAIVALVVFDVVLIAFLLTRDFNGDGEPTSQRQVADRVDRKVSDSASRQPRAEEPRSQSPSASPTPSRSPSRSVTPSPTESSSRSVPPSPTTSPSQTKSPSRSVSPTPSRSPSRSVSPSPSSATSATSALHLRLPASPAPPSTPMKLVGRYVGAEPGTRLVLERRDEGRWLAFPLSPATREGGRFTTFVGLVVPGSYELRVRDPERGVTSKIAVLRIG